MYVYRYNDYLIINRRGGRSRDLLLLSLVSVAKVKKRKAKTGIKCGQKLAQIGQDSVDDLSKSDKDISYHAKSHLITGDKCYLRGIW